MKKKQHKSFKISKGTIISISIVASVFILIGFFAITAFSPVNSNGLVFTTSSNIFLKAIQSSQGNHHYQFVKGGKTTPYVEGNSPSIKVSKGNLINIHLINEEKNQPGIPSKHNLNIDEFNVHTKNLGYFQTESITFLADKFGTFNYYCSIHSEMKGSITVV